MRSVVLEALAVVVGIGIVATLVFAFERRAHPPPRNERPLGGPQIALAHLTSPQLEPAAAADPANPRSLVAMSLDRHDGTRFYESKDGGRTWKTRIAPPLVRPTCGREDPALAFVGRRLLTAFISSETCSPLTPELTVATRVRGRWSTRVPFRAGDDETLPPYDAAPSLAVDTSQRRVYVIWLRTVQRFGANEIVNEPRLLLGRSDDGGRTWRVPVRVAGALRNPYAAAIGVGRAGDVYVAVAGGDSHRLSILRSTDGGASFAAPHTVARLRDTYQPGCGRGGFVPRAQAQHCVGASPSVVTLPNGDVAVVYADPEHDGTEAIFSARFARDLRPLRSPRRVGPLEGMRADQFLPAAAYDPSTNLLWACYYDTHGDHARTHAWFTCTRSHDAGARWADPVRAAARPTIESRTGSDLEGYGDAEALVVAGGVVHPFWTDRREPLVDEDVFTTILHEPR